VSIRIGVIGAGANTRDRHIPGLRAVEGVQVVSVVNRTPESSARVAGALGIDRVAANVDELLADPEIDAVCIGTWPYRHRDFTVAALNAGKHVLSEARMASNLAEAQEMLAAAQARPDLVAQLVPAPFDFILGPTITRMIDDGSLGAVTEASVSVLNGGGLDPSTPLHWRQRGDYSGKNVMMLGIFNEIVHRWLGPTERVIADGRITVAERSDAETGRPFAIDIPDSYSVLARMASGVPVRYHLSAVAAGGPPSGISVYGTKATLHWTMDDRARWAPHGHAWQDITPDAGTDRGWQVESDFIASIRDGAPVRLTNFDDGVRYMRFIDGCWESWKSARAVDVSGK